MSPRQTVQVWQAGKSQTLHRVQVTDQQLSGIPHLKPIDCDSCIVVIPLAEVDSLRLTAGDRNAIMGTVLPVVFFVAAMLVWRASEKD